MRFIDLHVHSSHSSGAASPEDMLKHASRIGIDIGLCDGKRYDCASGIEISDLTSKNLRQGLDYVVVHGSEYRVNRLAVSNRRVDILAHPDFNRKDSGVDSIIAKKARENGVAIEVNLGRIINTHRTARVHTIRNVQRNLLLSRKYKFKLIVTSGAESLLGLRGATGVFELLITLGFTDNEAVDAMETTPRGILEGGMRD